ncbi:hypothetical protein V5P93_002252 [Actinokineospora auranticolor]|uniref:Excreted virulence factor EspC (Type VII ESX diderm) n=1 Tax=Actinokineospora auranticolor TaxID=155976 RepID=A0A2S6GB42_9PSEU|nr:type VII secretion target [Actinokineospora auranticolor]PPK60747.1 excreted virulence factor EspC (type VII ESX diderm) [Actinokineospora auranticolor]
MTAPNHTNVDPSALTAYARQLGYYETEAVNFGRVIDAADVDNEAWGVMGVWAKKSYADKLADLRLLLADLQEGVTALSDKLLDTAAVYQGTEDDAVMRFGAHEVAIDGPR